jgi:hypothetical protein
VASAHVKRDDRLKRPWRVVHYDLLSRTQKFDVIPWDCTRGRLQLGAARVVEFAST